MRLHHLIRSLSPRRTFATATTMPHPGFVGKCVLAPMVRSGELPMRLLSLKYGADAVWSPEVVDKGIIGCERVVNEKYGTIDFVKGNIVHQGGKPDERIVFRTLPAIEKEKLIFQIGTANPELAVEGAKIVAKDVAGIDVNSGCPKHFSIHAGMGAALLKNPDNLVAILTSLVREVGIPNSLPISVKIRLLDTLEDTLGLVERICGTGVCRITVHCRTTPMRPREPAIRAQLSAIASLCHQHNVQCYANGDIKSVQDAEAVMAEYGVDGAMIATAAEANPSCFRQEGLLPWKEVVDEYFRTAIEVGHYFSNTKFSVSHLVPGKAPIYQELAKTKTFEAMAGVLGIEYVPTEEDKMREPQQKVKGPKPNPPGSAKIKKSMQRSQKATGTVKPSGGNAQNGEGLIRSPPASPKREQKSQDQNQSKKRTEREGSAEREQMTNNQNNQNKRQKTLEEPVRRQRSIERTSVVEDMGSKMSEAF